MCGLIGWVGDNPEKFTYSKLHTLGVLNEVRGKHSCGISFDGEIWTGVYQEKLWRDFSPAIKDLLLEYPLGNPTVIGHTRWASVGGEHNSDNAHPFGFGESKNQEVGFEFCGVHNGTINNIDELAKRYGILKEVGRKKEKRTKIDSEILLEIIYKYGTKVLGEYVGGAALIWYEPDNPNVAYFWHGKSKTYPSSSILSEERPLFYLKEQDGSLYISSLEDSLVCINDTGGDIKSFDYNTVYKITNGDIDNAEKTIIDRAECYQKQVVVYNHHSHYSNHYDGWDDYPEQSNNRFSNVGKLQQSPVYVGQSNVVKGFAGKSTPSADNTKTEESREKETEKTVKTATTEYIDLSKEKARGKLANFQENVYYNRLRYWQNDMVITGIYTPMRNNPMMFLGSTPGKARENYKKLSDSNKYSEEPFLFYFFKGIALEKELDYTVAIREDNAVIGVNGLSYMSKYPILDLTKPGSKIVHNGFATTDFFLPYLSNRLYTVTNGECVEVEEIDENTLYDDVKTAILEIDAEVIKAVKPKFPVIEVLEKKEETSIDDEDVVNTAKDDIDIAIDEAMDLVEKEVVNNETKEKALGLFQLIKDQFTQTFEKLWQK